MITPSPYPGLRPFHQEEAHLFFGREAQVEDMLARLEERRFLAVVGTSGCGKSSLVRAGLLPALEQGFLSDANPHWCMAVMHPGSAPFDNLTTTLLSEAALGRERQRASQAAALLQATLRRGPLGLVEAVAESYLPEGTNLLLVVDQFEELFRYRKQTKNINDADAFVNLLLASARARPAAVPIYVVITMRSDFLGDCAVFTDLPETINDSQFLTPRPTRDQYRAAIVEPALAAGGQLTDALVNRLLNDLRGEPDQLPVLQHALMRMWTQDTPIMPARVLTLDDYGAVGGLAGALSKHCDEIVSHELTAAQQRIAEVMFRALCERSSEQRDTRRPAQLGEIAAIAGVAVEAVIPVVDAFRGAGRNFLMPPLPTPLEAETTLDISHESLIRQWPTLNTWVVAEAESARQYQRLEDVAKRRQQRGGAELWRGADLENARVWKEHEQPTEAWAARYGDAYPLAMAFLQASEAEEETQRREHERAHQRELEQAHALAEVQRTRAEDQARTARRLKVIAVAIGGLLFVILGVAVWAFILQNRATAAQQHAIQEQKHAEEQKQEAVRAAEEANRQRQIALVRLAHYFSAVAKASLEAHPTLSILLSIQAIKAALIPAAEEVLRDAITKIASPALVGHEDAVFGVAFSPDGQVLATASGDSTVRLWSLSTLTAAPRVLRGHEGRVSGVAFSPDGQVLATVSGDSTVRLWSLSTLTAAPRVLRHEGGVSGVAFSPDGQVLATASWDETVRLWSLSTLTAEPRVLRHEGGVSGIAFSPDGQVLATASEDSTVRLWSLSTPTAEPRILRGHEGGVSGVAFSPDGQVLATTSGDSTVRLWSLSTPTAAPRVLRGHEKPVYGVAFSPDGQVLATASGDSTVRLWSFSTPTAAPRVLRHEGGVSGVAFSPDGQVLATASEDSTVRLWSLSTPPAEPRVLRGHEGRVSGVAFSPDGQVLATASWDETVRLWSLSTPTAAPRVLRHENAVHGVAFSPDGQVLATTSGDSTVRLWSLSTPTAAPRVLRGHEKPVYGVAFSPDGQVLATASGDSTVRLWSLSTPTAAPRVLRGHEKPVRGPRGVAFSPDGQVLATASWDETVRLWSLSTLTAEPRVLRHEGGVSGVAFRPDGQVLATTSGDRTVRLWTLSTPTAEPRVLRGHEGGVSGVAFSPDGQVLATASEDSTVRLWSLSTPPAEPRVLRGHEGGVSGVAFRPDGQVLATASEDRAVRLWTLGIDALVRRACLLTSGNFSYQDWQQFLGDEPYRKTCPNRPLHSTFLASMRAQARSGDADGAVTKLHIALQVDGVSDVVLRKEARRVLASELVSKVGSLLAQDLFAHQDNLDAAVSTAVSTFKQAFELDPTLTLDPEKEARRIAASVLVSKGGLVAQVQEDNLDAAVSSFKKALELDPTLTLDPEKEARRMAARGLVDKGRRLAQEDNLDAAVSTAVSTFKQALELDPTLTLDPEKEARRTAARGLVDKGWKLAKQGAVKEAMEAYTAAKAREPKLEITANAWNDLCWNGSLAGIATDVMAACEQAVALVPYDGAIHDSRGVARVLTGDYPGAIQDFQQYLEWAPGNGQPAERMRQRQDWIRKLQANQKPFNEELLKVLRDQ